VGDAGFEGVRVALFIGLSFFGLFPLVHGYVSIGYKSRLDCLLIT